MTWADTILWWQCLFYTTYEGVISRLELVLWLPYLFNVNYLGEVIMTSHALQNFRVPANATDNFIGSMKPKLTFVCVKLIWTSWSTHYIETRIHMPQTYSDNAFELLYCLRQTNSRIIQHTLHKAVEFWRNSWNEKIRSVSLPCTLAITARCHASTRHSKETARLEMKHMRSLHIM